MAFPLTGVLDDFNRANESPLGPPWFLSLPWGASLDLDTNALINPTGGTSATGNGWPIAYGPSLEVWTILGAGLPVDGDYHEIDLYTTPNMVGVTPINGYYAYVWWFSGTYTLGVGRLDPGGGTDLSTTTLAAVDPGDGIGIRRDGTLLQVYVKHLGVWTLKLQVLDATYLGALYPTIGLDASVGCTIDTFGGGTLTPSTTGLTPPSTGARPVLLGAASQARSATLAAMPFAHTVPSGTGALLVYVAQNSTFQPLAEVTWNGTPLTPVPLLNAHLVINILPWTYLLLNPTPGAGTITVTPNLTQTLFVGITASAVNIGNYGGIRFADWAYSIIAPGDPPAFTPASSIHTTPTDLVLSAIAQVLSGATFGPVGQTLVCAQNGLADTNVKMAVGQADLVTDYTTVDWTLVDRRVFMVHVMAIKAIDGIPPGVHAAIGPVTNTFTTESQPAPPQDALGVPFPYDPPPGDWWHWWHTVPFTHRTLVVPLIWADPSTPVFSVTYNGVPMTAYYATTNFAVYVLENAPIGSHLIEVRQVTRRTFMAGAYSISSAGLIAANSAGNLGTGVTVASQVDAIVIAMADYPDAKEPYHDFTFGPNGPTLWDQLLYLNSNTIEGNRPNINETVDHGFSWWKVASGASTVMDWTVDPVLFSNGRVAFSFIPAPIPPPPVGPTGCPTSLPVVAVTGTGCSGQVSSPAV